MDQLKTHPASSLLPPEIMSLPKVEMPVAGVTGYTLTDGEKQLVFFLFDEGVSIPDHTHCEQRGMVVSGEMLIDIDGETNLYQAGDFYVVPAGARHRTSFSQPTFVIDLSDAPDRYKAAG